MVHQKAEEGFKLRNRLSKILHRKQQEKKAALFLVE